jgi:hypothetical protein
MYIRYTEIFSLHLQMAEPVVYVSKRKYVGQDSTYRIIPMYTINSNSFPQVDVPLQPTQFTYCFYHFDTIHSTLPHYVTKFFIPYVLYVSFCVWCTDIVRLLLYSTLLFAIFMPSAFLIVLCGLILPVCRYVNKVILRLRFVPNSISAQHDESR